MPETRVTIKRDGTIEIEGFGYEGEICLDDLMKLIREMEKRGVKITQRKTAKKQEAQMATV
ncbi:MAG: hypothetical protein JHC26_07500 [Thermofilum sp.]|uniref:hypothetical protein n=1 Tax=Thermofilum sp. TaxID=1961369 RepID=UPI002590741B|nr:hypothetical protein [Thermofilum sp.]MCI4408922.1 hypothetical protein [Thermofilum sp.]